MTDRVRHLTVVLDRDMRDDDVKVVVEAIRMIKFVAAVRPNIVLSGDSLARLVARNELRGKAYELIEQLFKDEP